jgi:2-C-methyl-D-erythritol 4-phosphate cytidylyltransferase
MDYAIIVAGGKGTRMGASIPKQFLPVNGLPVLMQTIKRFKECGDGLEIIIVLPKEQHEYWYELCKKHRFTSTYTVAEGGETRFHSVKNGLAMIPDDAEGIVGVHDGVRPFPSVEVIRNCYETARTAKAVVPVIPVVETLIHIDGQGNSETVPRDSYRLVQTPQAFDIQLLKRAYKQPYQDSFTDDASVVDSIGQEITLIDGNRENIKITTPFDLRMARILG